MNIIEEIRKDHQEVRQLFEKTMKEEDSRDEHFMELQKELIPHMKAEETIFYPLLMKGETKEDTLEGYEEHHASEMVLMELKELPPEDERWNAKLKVLKEMVEHHIMEEEAKLLVSAKSMLSEKELSKVADQFDKKKQELRKQI